MKGSPLDARPKENAASHDLPGTERYAAVARLRL